MLSLSEVQCIVGCSPGMPTPGHGSDPPPWQGLAWSLWRHWRVSRAPAGIQLWLKETQADAEERRGGHWQNRPAPDNRCRGGSAGD